MAVARSCQFQSLIIYMQTNKWNSINVQHELFMNFRINYLWFYLVLSVEKTVRNWTKLISLNIVILLLQHNFMNTFLYFTCICVRCWWINYGVLLYAHFIVIDDMYMVNDTVWVLQSMQHTTMYLYKLKMLMCSLISKSNWILHI